MTIDRQFGVEGVAQNRIVFPPKADMTYVA